MPNKTIESNISEILTGDMRKNASEFVAALRANGIEFTRGGGYWADKGYWLAMFGGEFVCSFLIGPEELGQNANSFIIWSDNCGTGWYENAELDEQTRETAWRNVDFCGGCGFCSGGTRKTIFGREFDNVCITAFRFDNPDEISVRCAMEMVTLRKNDIMLNKKHTI